VGGTRPSGENFSTDARVDLLRFDTSDRHVIYDLVEQLIGQTAADPPSQRTRQALPISINGVAIILGYLTLPEEPWVLVVAAALA
jgi:hypothetical protein